MRVPPASAVLVPVVALCAVLGLAAAPTFWRVSTQADLLQGEILNLSLDEAGHLMLGPETELIHETAAPFVWVLHEAADGAFWVGTGNDGNVYRIDPARNATLVFEAPELEIHAIAAAPNGGVYVGTSPDGQIYEVGADGTASTLFDPDDTYIWDFVVDSGGRLYAGTGPNGVIYTITPDGDAETFYETKATHVVSLAFDRNGNLVAGTESPGQVFRIDEQGDGFILLESSFTELRALTVDNDGVIYAAALRGERVSAGPVTPIARAGTRSTPLVPSVSAEITTIAIADVQVTTSASPSSSTASTAESPSGAVYRILPDGVWDLVWESAGDSPYDLLIEPDGGLLVATGPDGKIFRLIGDPGEATLITSAAAQQVTTFLRLASGQRYYATANPGKVFAMRDGLADEGSYLSEVRDAETVATWGTIQWRATTPEDSQIRIQTRSGNTRTPDDTWSSWSDAYGNPNGTQITNPKARYLQWRATLIGGRATPVLTSVTTAYLPRNLRPVVTSVTAHPPGTVFQKPFATGEFAIAGYDTATANDTPEIRVEAAANSQSPSPPLGRRAYRKGFQTIVWTAEDPSDDRLHFDILYRHEANVSWTALKQDLREPIFVWDTSSVPDGSYLVAVRASDAPSNSPDTALTGQRESPVFDIDNTPPRIEINQASRGPDGLLVSLTVQDSQSAIERVEYSLDASRWRTVYPSDGIADSRSERFDIRLPDADSATQRVVVRATDVMNNRVSAVADTRPPRDH